MKENIKKEKKEQKKTKGTKKDAEIEDVVFEEEYENTATEKKDAIGKLKERLRKCEEEKNRYLILWQKDKADFINARKDDEKRNLEVIKYAKESLVVEIFPVLDSFNMAMQNPVWNEVSKEWRVGVEYIYSQLQTALVNNGLEEIEPLGQPFNALEHHAVESVSVHEKGKDHKVIEVTQKGYKLNGKIIRPAGVKVGEYKA
ncbi:MAG: nucleotide exchange factor GrpE [Candidatus Pacebacteria bacterium]|nr:nucleotide exchange factor GrpE [Candidatus Paceibacterota bacterium]